MVGLKHADYDFDRRELVYKACARSAFIIQIMETKFLHLIRQDIDIYCYVETTWEIELLPPDDLL